MFQISGDAISGIVIGFVLGVIAYRFYDRLIYEAVEEGEKPIKETHEKQDTTEPKGEPRTYGRSCQEFTSAMNIDSPDRCQHLDQVTGYCNLFKRSVFILGGKYEQCAECKEKYPEK